MTAKDYILDRYKHLGGCAPMFKELSRCVTPADMVDVYIANPDWCMENNFPDLGHLREYFSRFEDKGIYIDKDFDGETFSAKQVYVFHNCRGRINVAMDYDAAIIPMLYFCNGCDMHVSCKQPNIVPIKIPLYIFGRNLVITQGNNNARFTRYEHVVNNPNN